MVPLRVPKNGEFGKTSIDKNCYLSSFLDWVYIPPVRNLSEKFMKYLITFVNDVTANYVTRESMKLFVFAKFAKWRWRELSSQNISLVLVKFILN